MEASEVTIGLAFVAGVISFISPCVLPLVPAYIGYLSGRMTQQVSSSEESQAKSFSQRFGTFTHGLFFVLGFTLFFVIFGLLTTAAVSSLESFGVSESEVRDGIARIGGTAVILFGLHIMGILNRLLTWLMKQAARLDQSPYGNVIATVIGLALIGAIYWLFVESWFLTLAMLLLLSQVFRDALKADSAGEFWTRIIQRIQFALYVDTRRQSQPPNQYGYLGSLSMGVVFSAGWTPCIGPIYGTVLTIAAEGGSVTKAGTLLTAYSLGLGIPFLMTALALDQAQGIFRRLQKNMHTIEIVSGVFLLLIGALVFTGQLERLTRLGGSGDLALNMENCAVGVVKGRVRPHLDNVLYCLQHGLKEGTYVTYARTAAGDQGPDSPDIPYIAFSPGPPGEDRLESVRNLSPLPSYEEVSALDTTPQAGAQTVQAVELAPPVASVPEGLEIGKRAPDFTASTLDGETISLSDFRGKIVLVNFWYTGCGPCRREMSDFEQVYNLLDQNQFVVLAVNHRTLEASDSEVADFAEELGLTFPVVVDRSGEINEKLYGNRISGYPTSFLLDADGVIVAYFPGIMDSDQLLDALEDMD